MNRFMFELLAYIESKGKVLYRLQEFANDLAISASSIEKELKIALDEKLLKSEDNFISISDKGLKELEPYRVKRAVVFAAGFGSRMLPVTRDVPKPMVVVNGKRIIDRLIDAMLAKDITDITIVRGYLKEKFDSLLEKYPFINFIDNSKFEQENNISSALIAKDKVDACYICAGDLLLQNPEIIKKYHYSSNYLASYSLQTDDWCFDYKDGFADNYRKGGEYCFNQYEIAYWTSEDCMKLREDWQKAYEEKGGKDLFWEQIPLVLCKEKYKVEIRQCSKKDIMEIDNFYELVEVDSSYKNYK